MHGLYPYRGKISAIDAKNIIEQLPKQGTLLDPFCGSGTIVYEAQKHGLTAIGVDNNPLALTLARAKIYKGTQEVLTECAHYIEKAKADLAAGNIPEMPAVAARSFHAETAREIMCLKEYFSELDDYLQGVFYGAIALCARGCNDYIWTSSTVGKNIEPKRYINFFEKMQYKAKKHAGYFNSATCPDAQILQGDSRKLSDFVAPHSIDYVFTSPPYFDGLDYTAYYGKLVYDIFAADRAQIKKQLIQSVNTYQEDMRKVLCELSKILAEDATMIFVVGDKKVKKEVINGGSFFSDIQTATYIEEREYTGTSSQVFDTLNNTARKEQIVVWVKEKGEFIHGF